MELRRYQSDFISDIRSEYLQGSKAPLGVLPTGGGKTVCMGKIALGVSAKGYVGNIIAHRQELIHQTSLTLARLGVYHNIIAPNSVIKAIIKAHREELGRSFFNSEAPTHVSSVQTLSRHIDEYEFDFLFFDEGHHAVAGSWRKIFERYPDAWMLGVTATPERLDGRGLGVNSEGCYTSLVEGPTISELTEQGFLAKSEVYAPAVNIDFGDIKTLAGDFKRDEINTAMDKPTITGDAVEHYKRYAEGMPAIAFCVSVEHAKHVAAVFTASGLRSKCVDGKMNDDARRQAIKGLGRGDIDVLTSCDLISEGVDVPIVGAAILLRPTKSLGLFMQQVGRVLRPYPGKRAAIILDHAGNCLRHGMPDQERVWSLDGRRKKGKRVEENAPGARQCMGCYAVYRSSLTVCPRCGTPAAIQQREVKEVDGQLVMMTAAQIKEQQKIQQSRAVHDENRKARTLEELIAVGKRRGYKNPKTWAKSIFNHRQRGHRKGMQMARIGGL